MPARSHGSGQITYSDDLESLTSDTPGAGRSGQITYPDDLDFQMR